MAAFVCPIALLATLTAAAGAQLAPGQRSGDASEPELPASVPQLKLARPNGELSALQRQLLLEPASDTGADSELKKRRAEAEWKLRLDLEERSPIVSRYEAPPDASEARRAVAYGAVGLGAAGVATALATGLLRQNADARVSQHCEDSRCDEAGRQAVRERSTLTTVNAVSWGVGLLGFASAGFLILTAPTADEPSRGSALTLTPAFNGARAIYEAKF